MSGVGGIGGSNSEVYYYNLEQNQAYIMAQNQLVPVSNQEAEGVLAKNDIKVKGGKAYSISDGYEIQPKDALIMTTIGGVPTLPATTEVKEAGKVAGNDIKGAVDRLADCSGNSSALLFMQLMTLMKTAREDKSTNNELELVLQKGKVSAMRGELGALAAKHEAERKAEKINFYTNIAVQVVNIAGTVAGLAGAKTENAVAMASNIVNMLPALINRASYDLGPNKTKGEQEIRMMQFSKESEAIQQTIDMVKSGSESAKKAFKSALQLMEGVAQRQNDSVKAMNV